MKLVSPRTLLRTLLGSSIDEMQMSGVVKYLYYRSQDQMLFVDPSDNAIN